MASFDFPRHPAACSQLEWEVYQATVSIPYGQVLSYGQVAAQCGPWRGAMGGGNAVHTKRRLLELESGVSQLRLF